MGTVTVTHKRRPASPPAVPAVPEGTIDVAPPPALPTTRAALWTRALPVVPILGGALATALLAGEDAGPRTWLVAGLFGVSALATVVGTRAAGGASRRARAGACRDYLRYLDGVRRRVRAAARHQHAVLHRRYPAPQALWCLADGTRRFERTPDDPWFATVRLGVAPGAPATPLRPLPVPEGERPDPVAEAARDRLLAAHAEVEDLPLTLRLVAGSRVRLVGEAAAARGLARSVVAQLATFHPPHLLRLVVCPAPGARDAWEWVKWLPHAAHPDRADAAGPVRLVTASDRVTDLVAELTGADGTPADGPASLDSPLWMSGVVVRPVADAPPVDRPPTVVVVADGVDPGPVEATGPVAVLHLDPRTATSSPVAVPTAPPPVTTAPADPGAAPDDGPIDGGGVTVVEVRGATVVLRTPGCPAATGVPDRYDEVEAEALARRLARYAGARRAATADPHRPATRGGRGGRPPAGAYPDLADLLGIDDPHRFEPTRAWAPRPAEELLRVPIGTTLDGEPVLLDLKESAAGGVGPHGLLVGATGSGKSELLRTIVTALAATHSSEQLNLVLVDFKGGATFAGLERLPHTAAVITNLADELPLVERMGDALQGELVRRQELLRASGNHPDRYAYERARAAGAPLPPLPVLLVVCDEFTELLAARPELTELFVQIGRLGRSLGVQLLLASQRLEEGRLRGLDTHLSYRIGLRTFSPLESRAVLGVPDAYELPHSPGHGFLRTGPDRLVRFVAAPASLPWRRPAQLTTSGAPGRVRVVPFGTRPVTAPTEAPEVETAGPPAPTVGPPEPGLMELLVERMVGTGPPAHRVWLPPLSEPPALTDLLGPLTRTPERGLAVADPAPDGALRLPLGVVDRPAAQRRDPLVVDLSGQGGHVAVVGGPRSGKSTVVATLVAALALTRTPVEAQVYCLDFGGGTLAALRGLPHVGGVAGRTEPATVRRTVADVAAVMTARERGGDRSDDGYGEVFLVVDGWSVLRTEFGDLADRVADLAARGLAYGVHVVATAARWMDFPPSVRDLFGSRVELRLGDPTESLAGYRAATRVPEGIPGRGVTPDGAHLLTALPRLSTGTGDVHTDLEALVAAIADAWSGPTAPPVRLLPERVPYHRIAPPPAADRAEGLRIPVGIAETDLQPAWLDLAVEPHLLVFGDSGSGKTTALRTLAASLVRRLPPEELRVVIVDYRRGLWDAVTGEHLIGYATAAGHAGELMESVAAHLERRLPGPDVTPAQLRTRSWWTGPECVVLVDDYDLVAGGGDSPLLPLLPLLPQARDVGLHLVVARHSGGAARALYEPVLRRLRELATPGLVMSGDPEEGPLVGTVRPGPLPPGRAWLVTRREGARLVQLPHPDDDHGAGDHDPHS